MHRGYIKLWRKVQDSWLFNDSEKFKAWVTILMEVNHAEKNVLIGQKLIKCKRGESLNSLETWTRKFGKKWNKSRTRRFLEMLKSCNKIDTLVDQKTTHLTVCNYDSYQSDRNNNETIMKQFRNNTEKILTPNNNVKNVKKNIYMSEFEQFWLAYPKKQAKKKSYQAFAKTPNVVALLPRILGAINWQRKTDSWAKDGGQYIPMPSTYLNNRRWEDKQTVDVLPKNEYGGTHPDHNNQGYLDRLAGRKEAERMKIEAKKGNVPVIEEELKL